MQTLPRYEVSSVKNKPSTLIVHFTVGSALDSIYQNHLGREGLRWNDGQLMTCYTK